MNKNIWPVPRNRLLQQNSDYEGVQRSCSVLFLSSTCWWCHCWIETVCIQASTLYQRIDADAFDKQYRQRYGKDSQAVWFATARSRSLEKSMDIFLIFLTYSTFDRKLFLAGMSSWILWNLQSDSHFIINQLLQSRKKIENHIEIAPDNIVDCLPLLNIYSLDHYRQITLISSCAKLIQVK